MNTTALEKTAVDRPLIAIEGSRWEEEITANPGSILVIDEDSQFIRSKEFAAAVRRSDNYFLLITRNYLAELPINVDEIFELTGAKNKKFKNVYQDIDRRASKQLFGRMSEIPSVAKWTMHLQKPPTTTPQG